MLIIGLILFALLIGGIICTIIGIFRSKIDSVLFGILVSVVSFILLILLELIKKYLIT